MSITPDWIKISASNFDLHNNRDHGLYGSTSCSHSLNNSKLQ